MPRSVEKIHREEMFGCNMCEHQFYTLQEAMKCESKHKKVTQYKVGQCIVWTGWILAGEQGQVAPTKWPITQQGTIVNLDISGCRLLAETADLTRQWVDINAVQ